MSKIAVLIDAELHNELVLRTRRNWDVTQYIENQLFNFLERTEGDDVVWSKEYAEEYAELHENSELRKYGNPEKGYLWQTILLQNGSKLKITYKGQNHFAEIIHSKIIYNGKEYTPAQWARHVANNTNRNAWMDIWVQPANSKTWKCANILRWEEKERNQ